MRTDGRFVTFDWTDACIVDPFVDVLMFLTRLPDEWELKAAFLDQSGRVERRGASIGARCLDRDRRTTGSDAPRRHVSRHLRRVQ